MRRLLKRIPKLMARSKAGRLSSRMLMAVGAKDLSRYSSRYTNYVPSRMTIDLPSIDGRAPSIAMNSLHGDDRVAISVWRYGFEAYESPLPIIYCRLAANSKVVLGVGANSGLYELAAAAYGEDTVVYGFEPYPPAIQVFKANVEMNGLASRIHIMEMAVADKKGTLDLYVPAKTYGTVLETSASLDKDFRPSHSEVLPIQVSTLDDLQETNPDLARVGLVRIDVEGMEHAVLMGAQQTLKAARPMVIIEVLEIANFLELNRFCTACDYVAFRIDRNEIVRQPTVAYHAANTNQLLCPSERTEELARLLQDVGISTKRNSPL